MQELKGTPGQRERARALVDLLTRECGELTEAEGKLAWAVALGQTCELLRHGDEKLAVESNQNSWQAWGLHRTIRSTVLRTLCSHREARMFMDPQGVRLTDARIVGQLNLSGANVPFDLRFERCDFEYPVFAAGTRIQTLDLTGTHVPGLVADRLEAQGGVFLRHGFVARCGVHLPSARIGHLDCEGGRFDSPDGYAIVGDRMIVRAGVFLRKKFEAHGAVLLGGADIGGDLDCSNGYFKTKDTSKDARALDATGATIQGSCNIRNATFEGFLDLTRTRIGSINDERREEGRTDALWPERLSLADCRYDALFMGSYLDARNRLRWLANHDTTISDFFPENNPPDPAPYRWLAFILRKQGHERDADLVLVRLGWRRWRPLLRQRLTVGGWARASAVPLFVLSFFYGMIVGHGYARFRPLWYLAGFWLAGTIIFGAQDGRRMQPTQGYVLRAWTQAEQGGWDGTPLNPTTINSWIDMKRNAGVIYSKSTWQQQQLTDQQLRWIASYPKFSPWVYSLDAFLPLVDFHQEDYWTPSSGWWAKDWYLPFHIASGWIIATLFAASFTRLARQD